MIQLRHRYIAIITGVVIFLLFSTLSYKSDLHTSAITRIHDLTEPAEPAPPAVPEKDPDAPKVPIFRPASDEKVIPIVDNFPRAAAAKSPSDLPPIPSWNKPPTIHVKEHTPVFIGFTRNWRLLQQAVVSYITAGWPPEDIYVVENTGTMDANRNGQLTLQNPFYLDYNRLTNIFGVNVLTTPTLLTFSQLQNFYLSTAINAKYPAYFWSHMDVVAIAHEERVPHKSLYALAVETLRESMDPAYAVDDEGRTGRWAIRFFAYDRLALVNTAAFAEVGGWDPQIPFYTTDCDMHERLGMAGFRMEIADAGLVFDTGSSMDDLEVLYRKKGKEITIAEAEADAEVQAERDKLMAEEKAAKEKEEAERKKNGGRAVEKRDVLEQSDSVEQRDLFGGKLTSSTTVSDLLKSGPEEASLNDESYQRLTKKCDFMQRSKNEGRFGRNTWQARQSGGVGEPYYRDPWGFEQAIQMTINFGRDVYARKWGHPGCGHYGLHLEDAWRVEGFE